MSMQFHTSPSGSSTSLTRQITKPNENLVVSGSREPGKVKKESIEKTKIVSGSPAATISSLRASDTAYAPPPHIQLEMEADTEIPSEIRPPQVNFEIPRDCRFTPRIKNASPQFKVDVYNMRQELLNVVLGLKTKKGIDPQLAALMSQPGPSRALQKHVHEIALLLVANGMRREDIPAAMSHIRLSNLCTTLVQGLAGGIGFNAGQSLIDYLGFLASTAIGDKVDTNKKGAMVGMFVGVSLGGANLLNEALTAGYPDLHLKYGQASEVDASLEPFSKFFGCSIAQLSGATGGGVALPMSLKNIVRAFAEINFAKNHPGKGYEVASLKVMIDAIMGMFAGMFISPTAAALTGQDQTEIPRILLTENAGEEILYAFNNFTSPAILPEKYLAKAVDQSCKAGAAMLFKSIEYGLPPFLNTIASNALNILTGEPTRTPLELGTAKAWIPPGAYTLANIKTPVIMALVAGYGMVLSIATPATLAYCAKNDFSDVKTAVIENTVKTLLSFYFYTAIGVALVASTAASGAFVNSVQKLFGHLFSEGEELTGDEIADEENAEPARAQGDVRIDLAGTELEEDEDDDDEYFDADEIGDDSSSDDDFSDAYEELAVPAAVVAARDRST